MNNNIKEHDLRYMFNDFHRLARSTYTQEKASNLWNKISSEIPTEDSKKIREAWFQYECGDGVNRLDSICEDFKIRFFKK